MNQGKANDGKLDEIDKALRLIQFHIDTGDNKPVHWRSTMTTGLLEAHQAIEALLERRVLEGRIEELGLLTRENFDGNADYKKWSKAVLAYMRTRLAMLVSLRGGEKE